MISYLKHFLTYDSPNILFARGSVPMHVLLCIHRAVPQALTHTSIPETGRDPPPPRYTRKHTHTHTHTSRPTIKVTQRARDGKLSSFMTRGQQKGAELCSGSKNKRGAGTGDFLKVEMAVGFNILSPEVLVASRVVQI